MLNRLIQWSLANRAIVLGLSLLVLALGFRSGMGLPVEVLPDLTKPTVIILTEAPGLAPEEVEIRVTQPLEGALLGVAGLTRLRSNSDVSLSLVYAEFGWDTDIYKARTLVQERLQSAREQLPADVKELYTSLTPTEKVIMKLIAQSKTSQEIAGSIFISPNTVDNHRANIARKLKLEGKNSLLKCALQHKDLI